MASSSRAIASYVVASPPLGSPRLCRHDSRKSIEKLLHLRRQRRLELVERALHIRQQMRARETLDQRAAEIQRAELGEGEPAARQRTKGFRFDAPELRSVDRVVVHGESGFLESREVATDRSCADAERLGKFRNGVAALARDFLQQRPLSD